MYVSPAVRTIRADPVAGESVTLLLGVADDASMDEAAAAIREAGGSVDEELRFRTLQATVPHERVDDVCDVAGVDRVETANTLITDADGAGEDVRPEE